MQIRRKELCLLALVSTSLAFTGSVASAQTLFGGVNHVDALPAIEDTLRPGKLFSIKAVKCDDQTNEWVKLPAWMGGTWHVSEETAVLRRNFKTDETKTEPHQFKASRTFVYGMQQDKDGGIWHYVGIPYSSKTRLSEFDEHHVVTSKTFDCSDPSRVSIRSVAAVVRVSHNDRTIIDSFQQESVTTYTPTDLPGELFLAASTKTFDATGTPTLQGDNTASVHRVKPFAPVHTLNGKQLTQLFRDYLIGHGLAYLLADSDQGLATKIRARALH